MSKINEVEKGYQGWTNYETWNVKLWIDNDQSSYNYWQDRAKEALKEAKPSQYFTKEQEAVNMLREALKEAIEAQAEDMLENSNNQASCMADLLHSAVSEVNFQEIAKSLIEDME